jgi:hypothetical protein
MIDTYEELAVIARELMEMNSNATFADLLVIFMKYKVGVDYSKVLLGDDE